MSLLDTLRKNLSSELFGQVTDALGDDFNYDLVPRSRLNTVIGQRDAARRKVDALTQGVLDSDDESDESEGAEPTGRNKAGTQKLPKGISQKDLDDAVQKVRDESEAAMKQLKLRYAVAEKLREANFTDPQLVLSANLIDFSKLTTDEAGNITGGLEDQVKTVAKDRPFLVGATSGGAQKGTGKQGGGDDFGTVTNLEEFIKLPSDRQIAFKAAYPDTFKTFFGSII